MPTVGGQTALNVAMKLDEEGILKKYNVELLELIEKLLKLLKAEKCLKAMLEIGLDLPYGYTTKSLDEAKKLLNKISLPAIIRPSFTLGGSGGSVAYNEKNLKHQ